jgi:hypothetical protein
MGYGVVAGSLSEDANAGHDARVEFHARFSLLALQQTSAFDSCHLGRRNIPSLISMQLIEVDEGHPRGGSNTADMTEDDLLVHCIPARSIS